jgi:ribonuclease P protein component
MSDQRLRPTERLRCPQTFQQVFTQGEKLVGTLFVLYVLPTSELHSRLGIAVSKRLGNAVIRNRIKRCLREMFRQHKTLLPTPCDVVCVARREAVGMPCSRYTQQFHTLLQHCQCLRHEEKEALRTRK